MIMKSQLIFSDLYSRYGVSQILKLHSIRSSGKLRTLETSLEQLKLAPLRENLFKSRILWCFERSFSFK